MDWCRFASQLCCLGQSVSHFGVGAANRNRVGQGIVRRWLLTLLGPVAVGVQAALVASGGRVAIFPCRPFLVVCGVATGDPLALRALIACEVQAWNPSAVFAMLAQPSTLVGTP